MFELLRGIFYFVWVFLVVDVSSWASQETETLLGLLEIGEKNMGSPGRESILIFGTSEEDKSVLVEILTNNKQLNSYVSYQQTSSNIYGKPTTSSFPTFLPQESYDSESETKFYNRPDVSSFGNKSMEVASAFFISKLLENTVNVKLIFVTHLSILMNPKRNPDFNRMLVRTHTLLKDLNEFFESVALIVVDDNGAMINDSTSTRDQLTSKVVLKVSQLCQNAPDQHKLFTNQFSQMISRSDENDNFSKVAVINLAVPSETEVERIKHVIHKELHFHSLQDGELSIRTSKASKKLVKSTVITLYSQMSQVMTEVVTKIEFYVKEIEHTSQFLLAYHKLKILDKFLSEAFDPVVLQSFAESKLSCKRVIKGFMTLEEFGISLSNDQKERISRTLEYIYRLQKIGNVKDTSDTEQWDASLKSSLEYTRTAFLKYSCLYDLYSALLTLKSQNRRNKILKSAETLGPAALLQEVGYSSAKCLATNTKHSDHAKRSVLQYALESPVNYECFGGNHLRVYGDFVHLRFVNFSFCSSSPEPLLETFELFAWNKIYIDTFEKFKISGLQKLVLISPSIEIQPGSEIDMSGRHGVNYGRAQDGNELIKDGKDGLTGKPGESGGSVLILTGSVVSADPLESVRLLQITSNGGDGGTGQDGGNGGPGNDGVMAKVPQRDEAITVENGFKALHWSGSSQIAYLKKAGSSGSPGGTGGNGGFGGTKGSGGDIQVVILGQESNKISKQIRVVSLEGRQGVCGKGGVGGPGGINGLSLLSRNLWDCTVNFEISNCTKSFRDTPWKTFQGIKEGRGPEGHAGQECVSNRNSNVTAAISLRSDSIAVYKGIARNLSTSEFRKSVLKPFLETLETTPNITRYYSIYGLIEEFNNINTMNIPHYNAIHAWEALANRTLEFLENSSNTYDSDGVLIAEYLYTASLSKRLTLQDHIIERIPIQITDIQEYLSSVKNDIEVVKNLRKSQLVILQTDKYSQEIHESINEADELIKQLQPALNTLKLKISNSLDDMIDEVSNMHNQAQANQQQLKAAKIKLAKNLLLQKIFGTVSLVGNALTFLGPKGIAAGVVINLASNFLENKFVDKDIPTPIPMTLPPGMTSTLVDKYKSEEINNQISEFNQTLTDITGELKLFKNVRQVSTVLLTIETARRKIMSSKVDKNQLETYKADVDQQIRKSESEIQSTPTKSKSSNLKKAFAALKKCRKIYSFYRRFRNVYKKLRNKSDKLSTTVDSVDEQLSEYESKVREIEQYHSLLEDTISPKVSQTIGNVITQATGRNQSVIGLDAANWNIQTTLRNMKSYVQSLTQGMSGSYELLHCIENMEFLTKTLIHIQNRNKSFQEQIRLADFIAKIETAGVTDFTSLKDSRLRQTIEDIDFSIKSNLVISEYERIIHAVKQWAFPFAHDFIRDLDTLGSQPRTYYRNRTDQISQAVNNILKLKQKVDKVKASIRVSQDHLRFTDPDMIFSTWNYAEYSSSIKDLLSGKEVTFFADIKKSPKGLDAIKFTFLRVIFRAKNETEQSRVDSLLQNFQIRMSHLGLSYFRIEGKFYEIPNAKIILVHSFRNKTDGSPEIVNDTCLKLKQGDPILSPYAMWKFKIEPIPQDSTANISLHLFDEKNVDIILQGIGKYVQSSRESLLRKLELDRYYYQVEL